MNRRTFVKFMAAGTVAATLPISLFGKFVPKDGLDLNKMFKGPYYLYEIPGNKVGVTTNLTRRYKYNNLKPILLKTFDCIYKVSEAEQSLQKEKGYTVDSRPYFVMRLMQNSSNNADARERSIATRKAKGFTPTVKNFEKYNKATSKAVIRINKYGIPTKYYSSIAEAARDVNSPGSAIIGAIKRNGTSAGYKWKLVG